MAYRELVVGDSVRVVDGGRYHSCDAIVTVVQKRDDVLLALVEGIYFNMAGPSEKFELWFYQKDLVLTNGKKHYPMYMAPRVTEEPEQEDDDYDEFNHDCNECRELKDRIRELEKRLALYE